MLHEHIHTSNHACMHTLACVLAWFTCLRRARLSTCSLNLIVHPRVPHPNPTPTPKPTPTPGPTPASCSCSHSLFLLQFLLLLLLPTPTPNPTPTPIPRPLPPPRLRPLNLPLTLPLCLLFPYQTSNKKTNKTSHSQKSPAHDDSRVRVATVEVL